MGTKRKMKAFELHVGMLPNVFAVIHSRKVKPETAQLLRAKTTATSGWWLVNQDMLGIENSRR
jgi:hypothetical protein